MRRRCININRRNRISHKLREGKSTGIDNLDFEMLKYLGQLGGLNFWTMFSKAVKEQEIRLDNKNNSADLENN